jgi:hypothetical protein
MRGNSVSSCVVRCRPVSSRVPREGLSGHGYPRGDDGRFEVMIVTEDD